MPESSGDFLSDFGRQAAEVGSRALGLPKRLEESLSRLEQGDVQVQVRSGDTDRLLRRLALAQQFTSQSFLLGGLAVAAAVLATGEQPLLVLIPLLLGLPVAAVWLRLQLRLGRDQHLPGPGTPPPQH